MATSKSTFLTTAMDGLNQSLCFADALAKSYTQLGGHNLSDMPDEGCHWVYVFTETIRNIRLSADALETTIQDIKPLLDAPVSGGRV
jgi:hypothetical protein